jgi:hypothetical protein
MLMFEPSTMHKCRVSSCSCYFISPIFGLYELICYLLFLKHLEPTKIINTLIKYKIICYFRYVDILIVYNNNRTDIHERLNVINDFSQSLKFALEEEVNNTVREASYEV